MVNLQIVFYSIGFVLVSVGRRILRGLSTDVEDFSRSYAAVDWIECFPIFILTTKKIHAFKENAFNAG